MVKFTLTVEPYAGDEARQRAEDREDERAAERRRERDERNMQILQSMTMLLREYLGTLRGGSRPYEATGCLGAVPPEYMCGNLDCPVCRPGQATARPRPPDFDFGDRPEREPEHDDRPNDDDNLTRVRE